MSALMLVLFNVITNSTGNMMGAPTVVEVARFESYENCQNALSKYTPAFQKGNDNSGYLKWDAFCTGTKK